MEIKAFLITFEKSLIADGFSPESARTHTLKIAKSLKDSDKAKIKSMQNPTAVSVLADKYAAKIRRLSEMSVFDEDKADTVTIARQFSESTSISDDEIKKYTIVSTEGERSSSDPNEADISEDTDSDSNEINVKRTGLGNKTRQNITKVPRAKTQKLDIVKDQITKVELNEIGKEKYRQFIMTKGIGIGAGVVFAGFVSIIVYAVIAVLIVSLVALLVAVSVVGCVGTLAGLIYGIVKLFSVLPEGLYELGLALLILGITIAAGIAVYNLAIRFVPLLWKLFTKFLNQKRADLRIYLNKVRTECNG